MSGERWPEEKLARVKRMWLEGWSASVVAAEIGVTRNGVIGKVTRLEIRRPDHVWQDGPRSMIELKRIVASPWKGQSRKKIVGASPFSTRRRCSCEAIGIGIFYAGAPPGALAVKRALNPAPKKPAFGIARLLRPATRKARELAIADTVADSPRTLQGAVKQCDRTRAPM